MDPSLIYSKTSKGARAALTKNKSLSSNCMLVLSRIDGKSSAESIQAHLKLNEQKFNQALSQLLDEAYIQVVQDFMPSVFDLKSAIEVSEISTEEFLNLSLPEETQDKTQEQLEAEARAKAYAEEQARKEAKAREQVEAERKLLMVTDILAKSGDRIDIEKLATEKPKNPSAHLEKETVPEPAIDVPSAAQTNKENIPDIAQKDVSLDFTNHTPPLKETIRLEAEAQAQNQSEEQSKQAAEQAAKKLAEERAQRAEAQQKSEEKAQLEATERARLAAVAAQAEIERKKQAEAAEKVRIKAEEKARKEEEKARREEERRARKEAERLQKIAEKKALEEERARARAEAEAKAREEAERRAIEKAEAEARARAEAEQRAKERAELQAKHEAEAKVRAAEKARAREETRIRKEALAIQKAEARRKAKLEAQARALVRAEEWARRRAGLGALSSALIQNSASVAKPLLVGLAITLALLVFLVQFISLSIWAQPMEQIIASNIGEPVKIQDMHASFWPQPHLVLENLTVGKLSDISARSIHVYPALSAFFNNEKKINGLEIEGLTLDKESISRPFNWASASEQKQQLLLENVSFKDVTIKMPSVELPAFDADIQLTQDSKLKEAAISSKNIAIKIVPTNDTYELEIAAQGWQPPFGPAITFDELTAKGKGDRTSLTLSKIEGNLYGGELKAVGVIDWTEGWKAEGNIELIKVNMALAAPAINERVHLQGKLYAHADFTSAADQLENLMSNSSVHARFEAENGEMGSLDLARAASGRQQVGGVTRFDQLTGNWALKDHQYQLTQLMLEAGSLTAKGEMTISPGQEVSGKVQTLLDLSSRQLQGRFALSGKLGNVRINR